MKRVLVTGAGGFIGRQTLPILINKNYDVHAVSLYTEIDLPGVTWHHADLLQAADRHRLIEQVQPTHILHFAWIAEPKIYWTSPMNQTWHDATLDLVKISKANGVVRFVGAGSCAEYDWSHGHCNEATPLQPSTPYGEAKAACGQAIINLNDADMTTAWSRIFFLYGPHEHPRRLVPSIIISLLDNRTAQCTHGHQVRDFLHVRDVASAFVAVLESDVTGSINIASGTSTSIYDFVLMIARQLGKSEEDIAFGAITAPPNDPPVLSANIDRLRREVGWKPSISLTDGIADAIQWWRDHR